MPAPTVEPMATRIDWFDDPNAPEPNSLIPAANVIVADDDGRILMIRRTDNGNYALPGGAMELGETISDTAVREALEETGYHVEVTGLSGIYSNPGHLVEYTSDGEVRQEFTIVYTGRVVGGDVRINDEASEVVWVSHDQAADLPMTSSVRERMAHFLDGSLHLG